AYQLAVAIFDQPMVKAIAVLLFGNVLAGIAVALYRRAFYLAALGDWLLSRAIPYVLGDATVQVMLFAGLPDHPEIGASLGTLVHGFVCAALLGHILQNLREIGLPIPSALGDKPTTETSARP